MPAERSLPTWWIKLWIAIGCFAFLLFIGVPLLMSRNVMREYARYQACLKHRRADCQPSLIWVLSDWQLATSTNSGDRSPSATTTSP